MGQAMEAVDEVSVASVYDDPNSFTAGCCVVVYELVAIANIALLHPFLSCTSTIPLLLQRRDMLSDFICQRQDVD